MSAAVSCGLDRLLADPTVLRGRRYGLLAHAGAVSSMLEPAHAALAALPDPPMLLFGPEHGYYGIEQYMVASADEVDPLTGLPVRSLYGDDESSLRPRPAAFEGLDLLIVDLQDAGARFYTYAATAVWAAEVALAAGCEVWVLDRPNPLGGVEVEGNLPRPGFDSFVGAFTLPVRHGLTLAELVLLEARRRSWPAERLRVWELAGWHREMIWRETGRPWISPSPNLPSPEAALLYPGLCLLEGTEISEGRGTARPFELAGAPGVDVAALLSALEQRQLPGLALLPSWFRPQFWKHAGAVCAGLQAVVTDAGALRPLRFGLELLAAFHAVAPEAFVWRREPYEFVTDRPAIDLLTGDRVFREALDSGADWRAWADGFGVDEAAFEEERSAVLLYPLR